MHPLDSFIESLKLKMAKHTFLEEWKLDQITMVLINLVETRMAISKEECRFGVWSVLESFWCRPRLKTLHVASPPPPPHTHTHTHFWQFYKYAMLFTMDGWRPPLIFFFTIRATTFKSIDWETWLVFIAFTTIASEQNCCKNTLFIFRFCCVN